MLADATPGGVVVCRDQSRLGATPSSNGSDLRDVFTRLFPEELTFHPDRIGDRQVWRMEGAPTFGRLAI